MTGTTYITSPYSSYLSGELLRLTEAYLLIAKDTMLSAQK